MRRRLLTKILLSLLLILLVLGTFITGIVQVQLDINQFFYHKVFAYTLVGFIVAHLVLNRKALWAYFRRNPFRRPPLGSRPAPPVHDATEGHAGQETRSPVIARRWLVVAVAGAAAGWALAAFNWSRREERAESAPGLYDPSLQYHLESRLGLQGAMREVSLRVFQFFRQSTPPLYKRYAGREILTLPAPSMNAAMSVAEAIRARRSRRKYAPRAISLQALSDLTYQAAGITGHTAAYGRSDYALRAAPSSGAKYPVELYLLASNVDLLDAGIYHYQVDVHGLVPLKLGDFAADFSRRALAQEFLTEAAVVFILTGYFARSASRYGSRAYRYTAMDAGHMGENLYLTATALGLSVTGVGAFFDGQVNDFLGIDGRSEAVLYLNAVGHPA